MANVLQTANVLLAIGGDARNQVPKYGVTAAEVAVLQYIHGAGSVTDIEIVGEVTRTHRQEIGRLAETYGRQDGERRVSPAVSELFPGAAARVFETFDELEIPEDQYIATGRRKTAAPKSEPKDEAPAEDDLSTMTLNELRAHADKLGVDLTGVSKKADVLEAIETHQAAQADQGDDESDGSGEMADANLFK